jgi:hypothetical protein
LSHYQEKNKIIKNTKANEGEVEMAWSTYADGRWSPKLLATDGPKIKTDFLPKDFYFTGWVSDSNRLYLAMRGDRMVELGNPITGHPHMTAETVDVGYFHFDVCQSALRYVKDATLSTSQLGTNGSLANSSSGQVIVPASGVQVADSVQSFDSRRITGDALALQVISLQVVAQTQQI